MAEVKVMTFAVAELGAMKVTVDSLPYSLNKTEQTKTAKLILSFLSQMSRVRGGKALANATLISIESSYKMDEDELIYKFYFTEEEKKTQEKPQ